MKKRYEIDMSRTELEYRIDEWVLSERDRRIMRRRLIDGICLDPLSEEFDMSVRQINRIIRKHEEKIFR